MAASSPSPGSRKKPRTPDTAYRNTEEGRALLQSRVVRYAKIISWVSVVFYPLGMISRYLVGSAGAAGWAGVWSLASLLQAIGCVMFLALWWWAKHGEHSERALRCADVLVTLGGAGTWELMGIGAPAWTRPDMFTVFVVSQLLALRATIIPCTVNGSTFIAILSVLPIPITTYFFFSRHPLAEGPTPFGLTFNSALSSTLVVVIATVVSRTVHGLRERVREAMKLGQYTLDEKIGEGGMGVVYRASHALLRRPTAIKLLPPERAGEHNLVRFEREVQLTSMLTHPNTVSIYDFGRTPEGTFYYAMEYLEGLDLQTLVDSDGPQPAGRVAHILAQVCGALTEAHGVGLIHRDVKPANVILCERGGTPDVVKVLDFGLVKQLGPSDRVDLTASGTDRIIGTPLYLSPEAITDPNSVDGRSDLYALGAVGYMLLTGLPPFTGASVVEVCGHHLHTKPTPPSEKTPAPIHADLEQLLLKCLAKSPSERPPDAATLRRELLASSAAASYTPENAAQWWQTRGRPLLAAGTRPAPSTRGASPSVILTRAAVGHAAE
ncbi:MAG TPA: serine/threonine-protein kinase [Polyangiaceae bacterium]|nr:serine/threonine-protein kinase [Polyangiaceae bacterium]